MTKNFTPFSEVKYKVGEEILISLLEGGEEYTFTIVEAANGKIIVEDENGRQATLEEPPKAH